MAEVLSSMLSGVTFFAFGGGGKSFHVVKPVMPILPLLSILPTSVTKLHYARLTSHQDNGCEFAEFSDKNVNQKGKLQGWNPVSPV